MSGAPDSVPEGNDTETGVPERRVSESRLTWLESVDDPRVAHYSQLSDSALRRRVEPESGIYIAESSKVLRRALDAGHEPLSFFLAEKWVDSLADVFAAYPSAPVFVGSDAVLEGITGFLLHRGALAAMRRPGPRAVADVVARASRVAVVEDVVDHTNLGAIFRNAAALGIDAVILSPQCADPLYRRAIRVSMGAVFQVPWARAESWPDALGELREQGFEVWALALGAGSVPLGTIPAGAGQKVALMLGTEGAGLSEAAVSHADRRVVIPMSNGVDSLNVAAASAIAFYTLSSRV